MKKINLSRKLKLNKITISTLNIEQSNNLKGGSGIGCTFGSTCKTSQTLQIDCTVILCDLLRHHDDPKLELQK